MKIVSILIIALISAPLYANGTASPPSKRTAPSATTLKQQIAKKNREIRALEKRLWQLEGRPAQVYRPITYP